MKLTKPIGTRWWEETLEKIKSEQNLSSPQAVLYWLLAEYERRGNPSLEAPTMERNMTFEKAGGGIVGVQDLTNPLPNAPRAIDTLAAGERLKKLREPKNGKK